MHECIRNAHRVSVSSLAVAAFDWILLLFLDELLDRISRRDDDNNDEEEWPSGGRRWKLFRVSTRSKERSLEICPLHVRTRRVNTKQVLYAVTPSACVCLCLSVYACVCLCLSVSVCVCLHAYACICLYMPVSVCGCSCLLLSNLTDCLSNFCITLYVWASAWIV